MWSGASDDRNDGLPSSRNVSSQSRVQVCQGLVATDSFSPTWTAIVPRMLGGVMPSHRSRAVLFPEPTRVCRPT
jgi:hypothetical protein